MSATEFFRSITADEIERASSASDSAEDAAAGGLILGTDYIDRLDYRLRDTYPALYERIRSYIDELQASGESNPAFFMGIFAGSTMQRTI